MATRSRKDWLSPHKVSLLILIKYISSSDDEQEDYLDCLRRSRHKLSLLLLEFFEVPLFSCKLKLYWNWFRFIQQIVCGTFRRGSRINADRFPKRAPQAQASRGFGGNALLGIFFIYIFNSRKVSFHGFLSRSDRILESAILLRWNLATWKDLSLLKMFQSYEKSDRFP